MSKDPRPTKTATGLTLKNGDLIRIPSRGFVFVCFIDDTADEYLRPATPTSQENERWLNAPDWDEVELLERCAVRLLKSAPEKSRLDNLCLGCGTELSCIDEDPNGAVNPKCAQYCAEERHDFDAEHNATFSRSGKRKD